MQARVFPDGRLALGGMVFRAALGPAGITIDKREGDGATPSGLLPLRRVLYRADRVAVPRCAVPVEPVAPTDGWCDDLGQRDYNRMIRLPHDGHYEELWRQDSIYDLIGILGWNDEPVHRGRGSAIFLHVARPDYAPTAGCIALSQGDLRQLLEFGLTEILAVPG
ncbi:MAG TPA: L,D-transpeptidase family protein [Acetobacteraceae bacterium]|nr:L,D-transpeptidase family protein [Acetobacteraceae bacterium]